MKPQDGGTRPRWFTFETDVRNLMRALGFTVQHVSTAHGGDHGVDVLATKGHDLDEVNWIIQCKCFRPDRRIGPSVIREIIGALHNKPAGTRGMVVTTSAFTTGAIELAHQANIRLIDGEELSSRIQGAER
jgi:HJR/Mrr/RecB family endonuclease